MWQACQYRREIKIIADIVAFNEATANKAIRFGKDLFVPANLINSD